MKVKLVFEKSYQLQTGLTSNTFAREVDIELPDGFDMAHLVSARCYGPSYGKGKSVSTGQIPMNDITATVTNYQDESNIVGKLLTYIDATYTDPEQRKAHKDIVKDMVYSYYNSLRERASQLADFSN